MYPDHLPRVELPTPSRDGGGPLFSLLAKRRSLRKYENRPLLLQELSQLLWAANGVTRKQGRYLLRTAPSAGALYPVETYVLVTRVESLAPGIYHYEVPLHRLACLRSGSFGEELAQAALHQTMIAKAPCTFVWSMLPGRSQWKYGERAYRYICMDAGHIAQNVALTAVSLGMGSCQIAAFTDAEVNRVLALDGKEETALYITAVGFPAAEID
jgi:SagB-type dehydrogenase family enzyme